MHRSCMSRDDSEASDSDSLMVEEGDIDMDDATDNNNSINRKFSNALRKSARFM